MDIDIKDKFMAIWGRYFNSRELPIFFYYTDNRKVIEVVKPGSVARCLIGALAKVRLGKSLCFSSESVGCPGGRRYLGFTSGISPDFDYFLSCGIPGKIEGERYKKSPAIVKKSMRYAPAIPATAPYVVFKRWDNLEKDDKPIAVIFFAQPDVLSGLFTLANFDRIEPDGVIAPFGSGCSSIVSYPMLESRAAQPRAVLGMFDVSARPFVPADTLSFAVPFKKFVKMVNNAEESFLITNSWRTVQKRIGKTLKT